MKSSKAFGNTFKQMNLGGSIMKAYYNLRKKRSEIGDSVKKLDKIEIMDNPDANKVNRKEQTEEGSLKKMKKKNTEPFYKTHIVNMSNFEELMQSNDKLTEDNKILVQLFDKMKDRTFSPKSQPISNAPTHRAKKQSNNYNQTFSSSEFWRTPKHKLLSTAATFGMTRLQETDEHKKNVYFKKDLNPALLQIIKAASYQQEKNETNQKEMKTYLKAIETNGFDLSPNQAHGSDKKRYAKLKIRKYKDNSKFSFPLINQIIYAKKRKVDVFEKAKENMIKYFEEEYKNVK